MDLPIDISGRITSTAGRPRDPLQVLLLMLGTLGLFWFVWAHAAFAELSKLHRRSHPLHRYVIGLCGLGLLAAFWPYAKLVDLPKSLEWALLVTGLIGIALSTIGLLYLFMEVAQLDHYRLQRNMKQGISVFWFALWFIIASAILAITNFVQVAFLPSGAAGIVIAIVGVVVFVGLMAWIHFELQKSINEIWKNAGVTG